MFVEGQHEITSWMTILGTEGIDPLDGFEKDLRIETIRVVSVRRGGLPDPDVEYKTVEGLTLLNIRFVNCRSSRYLVTLLTV